MQQFVKGFVHEREPPKLLFALSTFQEINCCNVGRVKEIKPVCFWETNDNASPRHHYRLGVSNGNGLTVRQANLKRLEGLAAHEFMEFFVHTGIIQEESADEQE